MTTTRNEVERGVLNETTMTIHKHELGGTDLQTVCGHTYHVDPDRLRTILIGRATDEFDASKCGQCFEDGRGY